MVVLTVILPRVILKSNNTNIKKNNVHWDIGDKLKILSEAQAPLKC
jgi:hypothetical protein